MDSRDPEAQARWWADVFGVQPMNDGQEFWFLEEVPGMPFESIVFTPVPEPKTVKNRIHWDLYGDADDLVARGATVLAELPGSKVLDRPGGQRVLRLPGVAARTRDDHEVSRAKRAIRRDHAIETVVETRAVRRSLGRNHRAARQPLANRAA